MRKIGNVPRKISKKGQSAKTDLSVTFNTWLCVMRREEVTISLGKKKIEKCANMLFNDCSEASA